MIIENRNWTEFRKLLDGTEKDLYPSFLSDSTSYTIRVGDNFTIYECGIFKANSAPNGANQTQHDSDRDDFETNFKDKSSKQNTTPVVSHHNIKTNGHYKVVPVKISIPDTSTSEIQVSLSFDYDIEILSANLSRENLTSGEKIRAEVQLGIVGVITENATTATNTIKVSPTAYKYADPGFFVKIGGIEYEVSSKNLTNSSLMLSRNLDANVSTNDVIYLRVEFIPNTFEVIASNDLDFGKETQTGSLLPAGAALDIYYTPVSGAARVLRGWIVASY